MIVRKFAFGILLFSLAAIYTPIMRSYASPLFFMAVSEYRQVSPPNVSFTSFVPVGTPIRRELGTYTEILENCRGIDEVFLNTPPYPLAADHLIEWSYQGVTGTTFQLTEWILNGSTEIQTQEPSDEDPLPGILSEQLNLHESFFQTYGEIYGHSSRRGSGWILSAEPNTAVEYTLIWAEIWQPGYVDINIEGRDPIRVNILYRTDILGEADSLSIIGCQETTIIEEIDTTRPNRPFFSEREDRWANPTDNATYRYIEPGTFVMGNSRGQVERATLWCNIYFGNCESEWFMDEQPIHQTFTDAFWMMETEVTNAQYQLCVEEGACSIPRNDYWELSDFADYPVTNINWFQAVDYATWVGGRLPTEAEWERAARGYDQRIYPWGDQWDASYVNYCDYNCEHRWNDPANSDLFGEVAPVGSYPKGRSPYGLLDMAGNVWEWTADWYEESYYRRSPTRNPTGPSEGENRALRGGSYQHGRWMARATARYAQNPNSEFGFIGFRVVVDPRLETE